MRFRKRSAVVALVTALVGALPIATPAAAFAYPGGSNSWYMDTVTTSTLYDMGCALGTARANGSAPQDALVILDYGQAQLRSGVYGTYDFSNHYRTVTQIRAAVKEYAHGFYYCTGSNTTAHVRIGIGTSNYANWCTTCGMTNAEVAGFGTAWANMVDATSTDIYNAGYGSQVDVVGAADIEVSWGTSSLARSWMNAYEAANNWAMYDFGDAAGCRTSGTTKTSDQCGSSSWYQDDLYFIAWGSPSAVAVPEIYRTDGVMSKQWQQISKWATLNGKSKIGFTGSMTTTTGNTISEGWTELRDTCAADAATALSALRFATKIQFH